MTKSLISWVNLLESATLTAASASADLPVTNLATQQGSEVWRSLLTTTWFAADLGSEKAFRLIALVRSNLSTATQMRLRLSNVALGAGELLDTTVTFANNRATDSGDIRITEAGDVRVLEDAFDSNISGDIDSIRRQWIYVLPAGTSARYVKIDVIDPSNPDGYIDIGFGWVGDAVELTRYPTTGGEFGADDLSIGTATLGGQTLIDERPDVHVLSVKWDFLTQRETYDSMRSFLAAASKTNAVVVPNPDSADINVQTVLGLIQRQKRMVNSAFTYSGVAVEIRERL